MRNENSSRREALQKFVWFAAASPLLAQNGPPTIYPPTYSDEVMVPVNVHEIEEAARKKIHPFAYDYIAGGSAGEQTMRANRESFSHIQLRRRVGVDTSKIDTSLELFGAKLDYPILLDPTGGKTCFWPDADNVAAEAAARAKTVYVGGGIADLVQKGKGPINFMLTTTLGSTADTTGTFAMPITTASWFAPSGTWNAVTPVLRFAMRTVTPPVTATRRRVAPRATRARSELNT